MVCRAFSICPLQQQHLRSVRYIDDDAIICGVIIMGESGADLVRHPSVCFHPGCRLLFFRFVERPLAQTTRFYDDGALARSRALCRRLNAISIKIGHRRCVFHLSVRYDPFDQHRLCANLFYKNHKKDAHQKIGVTLYER